MKKTWLENQLEIQFNRALAKGWLPFFVEAADAHTTGYFDAADLLGIASRETNLDPVWLTKAGDRGNGYGLMQADVRSFPEWIKSGKWTDAREGILMGARVLMMKLRDVQSCIGKRCEVRSSRTKTVFTFIGKRVEGAELQKVTVAAYNGGRWAHYAVSKGQPADKYTTGGDYSTDAQNRARFFRPLVEKWMADNMPATADLDDAQRIENSPEDLAIPVVLTPTGDSQPTVKPDTDSIPEAGEKSKVKEFSEKYLKHCPQDTAKNVLTVIAARIVAALTTVWTLGLHGQILLIVAALSILGFSGYAFFKYKDRIVGWVKDLADPLMPGE